MNKKSFLELDSNDSLFSVVYHLFSIGVKVVYKGSIGTALGLGTTGFLIYQLFFLIFKR